MIKVAEVEMRNGCGGCDIAYLSLRNSGKTWQCFI